MAGGLSATQDTGFPFHGYPCEPPENVRLFAPQENNVRSFNASHPLSYLFMNPLVFLTFRTILWKMKEALKSNIEVCFRGTASIGSSA